MEDARKQEFKDWTKSTIRDETRNLVTDADRDAAPIHAAWSLRGVLGSGDLFNADEVRGRKAEQKKRRERVSITAEEKAAEEQDPEVARLSLIGQPVAENKDDEVRLKSKLNLSRRLGRLELKNPLIVPAAQVDFRSSERLEVRAAKELKSLETETSVSYGIEHKTLAMNLNKKITDEISCELKSTKSTLPQVVSEEAMKLNYRIHF
jgi:hypothetical protein